MITRHIPFDRWLLDRRNDVDHLGYKAGVPFHVSLAGRALSRELRLTAALRRGQV